jgi:WD40 repeat protein
LWDARTGKELHQFKGHAEDVACVAFSPDGKALASGSWDTTIRFWNVATGEALPVRIDHREPPTAIAYAPDGKSLASGSRQNETIHLWETATGKEVRRWKAHRGGVWSVAFSPDGKALASGGSARTDDRNDPGADAYALALWNPASGEKLWQGRGHTEFVGAVAFSPDGKTLASAGSDRHLGHTIGLWEAAGGKETQRIKDRVTNPQSLAFTPDGATLAVADVDAIHFWDVRAGEALRPIPNGRRWAAVMSLAISPDGKTLACACGDGQVRLRGQVRLELPGPSEPINAVAVSADGKTVVTGSPDGTARTWEMATGKLIGQFRAQGRPGEAIPVRSIALSPDGKLLALAHSDEEGLTLWSVADGKRIGRITGRKDCLTSAAFSPPEESPSGKLGRALATQGFDDEYLHLWDVATRKEVRKFRKDQESGYRVAFAPDGKTIASLGSGLYLWETATGKLLHRLQGGGNDVAFSPDGSLVATAGTGVRLFDTATGEEAGQHADGPGNSWSLLAFSPGGSFLAVAGPGGVRVLDVVKGQAARTFAGHQGMLTCIAYAPDGRTLISGSDDGTALVWDVADLARQERSPLPLKPGQLPGLWDALKGVDDLKAYGALHRLERSPAEALTLVRRRLRPAEKVTSERLAELIAALDDDRFTVRERASLDLEDLGVAAMKALRKAATDSPSAEVRRRVESLLDKLDSSGETRLAQRGVRLLERLGSPEARKLLEELARGEPEATKTREAKAALQRLADRAASP